MRLDGKVAWFKTTKKTSFGKVRLKHRELFFDGEVETKSLETVEKAYRAVTWTIALGYSGGTRASERFSDCLQAYFKSGTRAKGRVLSVLELIQGGMRGGFSLKTDVTSTSRFTNVFGIDEDHVPGIEGYVRGVGGSNVGNIHVNRNYIMNNRFMAVCTMIHEASHRFAQTADFGEQGYIRDDGSDFREPGITAEQCLRNADSYAFICMTMGYR